MIKGLYFKLNPDDKRHSFIIDFFNGMKKQGFNKVDVLYYLCRMDMVASAVVKLKRLHKIQVEEYIKNDEKMTKEFIEKLESEQASWASVLSNIEHNQKTISQED